MFPPLLRSLNYIAKGVIVLSLVLGGLASARTAQAMVTG